MIETSSSIESLLQDVLDRIRRDAPHLEWLFSVFAQEARFGRAWLEPNLVHLGLGASVLEVGAGLMLLSSQLTKEGFKVTALEPIGEGFSSFAELQKIVLAHAEEHGIAPLIAPITVERLDRESEFDFAFSINVMEHIENVALALQTVGAAIRPGSKYRFTCANYLFPYEPHFNIPTLFSKALTKRIFYQKIFGNTRVGDSAGVWNSLNWITVPKVLRAARNLPNMSVSFNRSMLETTLLRVVNDPEFSARRSPFMRRLVQIVIALGLHRLGKCVSPSLQPMMDCTMKRHALNSNGVIE
jgi:SAM-dependent methyltransferase